MRKRKGIFKHSMGFYGSSSVRIWAQQNYLPFEVAHSKLYNMEIYRAFRTIKYSVANGDYHEKTD